MEDGINYDYHPKLIPIIEMVKRGDIYTVKKLTKNTSDKEKCEKVNQVDQYGNIPLLEACNRNDYKMAKLLIKAGAKVYYSNLDGLTPLIYAEKHENEKLIKLIKSLLPEFLKVNVPKFGTFTLYLKDNKINRSVISKFNGEEYENKFSDDKDFMKLTRTLDKMKTFGNSIDSNIVFH